MAKTKRRSCKGGRKSRRCRGGLPKPKLPPRGYRDSYYANGKKAESGSRIAEPTLNWNLFATTPQTDAQITEEVNSAAKRYMMMRRLRELARGVRASIANFAGRTASAARDLPGRTASAARDLPGRTASAARGLKDSVLGLPGSMYQMLLRFPRFEKEKLVPANMTKFGSHGVQNYLYNEHDDIFSSDGDRGKKLGEFYKEADGKYHPYFLEGEYNPEDSWTMTRMDTLSKNYRY